MARCCNCSAPLPTDTALCRYCGTRNDMDLSATGRFAVTREESGRQCPHCHIPLQTIRLTPDGAFVIERCPTCFGLFFDPGELQAYLHASVAQAFDINFKEIANISRERGSKDRQVRYIKCPDCGKFMSRINFGYRSGVVLDQCRNHGIWLDNGELIHLMEWKKAGGQLLDEQKKIQLAEEEQRKARAAAIRTSDVIPLSFSSRTDADPGDLAQAALSLLSKFFG
ncbi:MAG: zf-TFIIB domain-containing protein [Thermodesulfobacteriota bacterium]